MGIWLLEKWRWSASARHGGPALVRRETWVRCFRGGDWLCHQVRRERRRGRKKRKTSGVAEHPKQKAEPLFESHRNDRHETNPSSSRPVECATSTHELAAACGPMCEVSRRLRLVHQTAAACGSQQQEKNLGRAFLLFSCAPKTTRMCPRWHAKENWSGLTKRLPSCGFMTAAISGVPLN